MHEILTVILFLIGAANVFGQKVEMLQKQIDSLGIINNNAQLVGIAEQQKRLVDLQYYDIIFRAYKSHEDKTTRILAFKEVRSLQYYLYDDDLIDDAINLYKEATKKLIIEYEGDVELLESIEVTPSVRLDLYPVLKKAIEKAGGKWNKGEILYNYQGGVPVRGNLIPNEKSKN